MEWFSVTESAAEASEGINSHQPLEVLQRKRGSERLDNLPTDTKPGRGSQESAVMIPPPAPLTFTPTPAPQQSPPCLSVLPEPEACF